MTKQLHEAGHLLDAIARCDPLAAEALLPLAYAAWRQGNPLGELMKGEILHGILSRLQGMGL